MEYSSPLQKSEEELKNERENISFLFVKKHALNRLLGNQIATLCLFFLQLNQINKSSCREINLSKARQSAHTHLKGEKYQWNDGDDLLTV